MKKKILYIVLSVTCMLYLAACSDKAKDSTPVSVERQENSNGSTSITDAPVTDAPAIDVSSADTPASDIEDDVRYVLMNIPYGDFFAAEFEGGEKVDAVTSATKNKPSNENLTGGTYHLEDNSMILGVSYPVMVSSDITLDENLKVEDSTGLLAASDYSYAELTDIPAYYKELTVSGDGKYVFGKAQGDEEVLSGENVKVNTATNWGDYEIDMDQSLSELTVFAAMIRTTDGSAYGFRTLENLWRGFEIAFATTADYKEPHGNTVSYIPYADLPGKTVEEITLYTTSGIKKMATSLYLPLKFNNTITAANAGTEDKLTTVSFEGFPADYDFKYDITGAGTDMICSGAEITWSEAMAGTYTLNVSDNSGVYAPYSTKFVLSTDKVVAVAKEDGIEKASDASEEEFAEFIKNITSYVVNGEEVAATGKRGAKIITEDGSADKTLNKVFTEVKEYEIIVRSAGYPEVTFKVNITEVAPTEEKK